MAFFLNMIVRDADRRESRVYGYTFGGLTPVGVEDCGVITVTGNDKVYSMILEVNDGGRVKYKITGEEFKNKNNNN